MVIVDVPFGLTDWAAIRPTEHKGQEGTSYWRTFEAGNIRVRMVEYSAGYLADHWCPRGHVVLVLEGEFSLRLEDGRTYHLRPGMSFAVSDDERNRHLGFSPGGAKVFIVD